MLHYLDSSVALRAILDVPEREAVVDWVRLATGSLISSRLLRTEVVRVLRRDRRPLADGAWLLDRVNLVNLTPGTHDRAEAIEPHVKTLDALHLATAARIAAPVTIVSHDDTMLSVAAGMGFTVFDPCALH